MSLRRPRKQVRNWVVLDKRNQKPDRRGTTDWTLLVGFPAGLYSITITEEAIPIEGDEPNHVHKEVCVSSAGHGIWCTMSKNDDVFEAFNNAARPLTYTDPVEWKMRARFMDTKHLQGDLGHAARSFVATVFDRYPDFVEEIIRLVEEREEAAGKEQEA